MQRFVKVSDQNRMHLGERNQRTGTLADFTVPWQDCQKQPPGVLYKKTILKNFAISTENTSLFLKKLQTFRPTTLLKRDPNTSVFL